jgi:hypothetical protein
MRLKRVLSVFVLLFGLLGIAFPQAQSSDQSNQGVKGDVQDAGHSTKRAAKKTGHKVKRGSKKTANKAARKTSQGANKVEEKTQTQPQ